MRVRALAITVLLAVLSVRLPAGAEQQVRDSELRAAKALDAIRGDPLALYVFLKRMPKGADLHNHLDGAVYAETFIRVGGEDGLCVDPVAKSFTKSQPIRSGAEPEPVCEAGDVTAAEVPKNQQLYDELVNFLLHARLRALGGRDRARPFLRDLRQIRRHRPAPHRRVSRRGLGPRRGAERAISRADGDADLAPAERHHQGSRLARGSRPACASELLAKGLAEDIPAARAFWDQAEATPQSARNIAATPMQRPAARSKTRYIYQVFRNTPKELVFAQTLFGFELAVGRSAHRGDQFRGRRGRCHRHGRLCRAYAHDRFPARRSIPRSMSACMPASWRRGSCRRRACAAMSGSPWSRRRPTASVMAST